MRVFGMEASFLDWYYRVVVVVVVVGGNNVGYLHAIFVCV